jgi:hypothetical protein
VRHTTFHLFNKLLHLGKSENISALKEIVGDLAYENATLDPNVYGPPWIIIHILLMHRKLRESFNDKQQVSSLNHQWKQLLASVQRERSPDLGMRLLHLAALIASGLGLNALMWSKINLHPWLLTLRGSDEDDPFLTTLVFAAPDLDVGQEDEIDAYRHLMDPYIIMRSPRDEMKPRIIGMLPEAEGVQRTKSIKGVQFQC